MPDLTTKLLEEITWQDAAQAAAPDYILILPVGSTEQHGPHLPLSTDVIIPTEIAKTMTSKIKAVVAPAIRYGYYSRPKSGGGEGFPGTTSISASTLIQTIKEVMKEYIRHGFRRFLLLNGHYENSPILPEVVEAAINESGKQNIKVSIMTWADLITAEQLSKLYGNSKFPGWETEHAAVMETSVMLHLRPELVRLDKLPDEKVTRINYEIIPAPPDTITRAGSL